MKPEASAHFEPYEIAGAWFFATPVGEFGPCGSKIEAAREAFTIKLAASLIVDEIRERVGGCFDELIGLPASFLAPLIGLSVVQTRRRLDVVQVSERDSRITLKTALAFIREKTKKADPLRRTKPAA